MKKIITMALCLLLVFSLALPAAAEGTIRLSVSASTTSACRGDSITFYISASGGGSCESFGLLLSYDSSVFEYVGGSSSVSGALISSMTSTGLVVSYNGVATPSGNVGSFTLRVKNSAPFGSFTVSGSANANGAAASASGATVTVSCNHNYSNWQKYSADSHQKSCSLCGGTQEEGHAWNEGTLISAPTCKEDGSKTYTCTVCGEVRNEVMGKTEDHQYGAFAQVDGETHKSTCSICQKTLTMLHSWDNGKITKAETCKETGTMQFTCADCGMTKEEIIPVSLAHKYSAWTKVDEQNHQRSCSVCNKTEVSEHSWNNGSVTKKPNCIQPGTCLYTCSGCGETKTEELPVTGVHTYHHSCDRDCNVCGETRTTSHSYSTAWSKNANEHWHVCTSCGDKTDVKAHIPGAEATEFTPQLCTVCEYVLQPELTHEHNFAIRYTVDENGHWYACAGCEAKESYASHDLDHACDSLCESCGYTRETSHDISEEWFMDGASHYQKCVICGQEEEHIPHIPGAEATEMTPQNCEICGYELIPALGHRFSDQWITAAQTHYYQCACGEKADEAAHVWDEGVRDSGGTIFTCTVCLYQRFEPLDLSWLIYIAVAAVVAVGGIAALLMKKKR